MESIASWIYFLISYIRGFLFGRAAAPTAPRFIPAPVTKEQRPYFVLYMLNSIFTS